METIQIKVKPGTPQEMDADDQPTFEQWMQRVDRLLQRHFIISSDDLPDCLYKDWYEERLRPIHAANLALENAASF